LPRSKGVDTLNSLSVDEIQGVRSEKRLSKVLRLINSQPACSVSDLALEVQISPAHLQRLFKQKTGLHVRDLIGEQRLQKAAHLLSSSGLRIKEIAHAVGYEHHSSFVRAFQRRFAQSPKFYREQNNAGPESLQLDEKAAAD
jgi:transcriptional regulator GlxA family with amidase domain